MSTLKLTITRGEEGNERELVEYEVPYVEGMSLLGAIFWLREHEDPSISVRYSCRSANACKECMATINGKVQYLCSTRVSEGQSFTIEPIKGRPWVRDLTTIME